jgi:hypothetical protein
MITHPDESDLIMWKETSGKYRYQTTSPKLKSQMSGRKTFHLITYSTSHNFWIFGVRLKSLTAAKSRYKGLTGRECKYWKHEGIWY